ncbi:MAG: methylenetetrahydrofolate reductase [Syntrophaceae bacterium]|nr:methylenetetrahydrofolate reductase [Syntrophaceae bacterium]
MKLTDLWATIKKPSLSFEFFPAKTPKGVENLDRIIDELKSLRPDFVSVTFGAGGSTREGSLELLKKLRREKDLETVAYFAGYGLGPDEITTVLEGNREAGVDNVLVVRGDPPQEEGFQPHPESLPHASDLLSFIRPRYDFCMGVAGYPEGHREATSRERDLAYLKLKVDLGADYIITNYCYENRFFFDFVERCQSLGINVPILPGVMPIYSIKMMDMLAEICGATVPEALRRDLEAIPEGDRAAMVRYGIDFAVNQCRELLRAGVPGIHLYTMDRSDSVLGIVQTLKQEQLL